METWWTDTSIKNILGYDLFYKNRQGSGGGGVCIYVKNQFKSYVPNIDVFVSGECEQVWCAVKCGVKTILCEAIYRKPWYDRS